MNEVKASMQDNKEWNIIRNDIKNVFDEKDISNRAKEFSDKIANTLTVAKNSLKTTYDKKIKSAKFSREINADTKIYINSKRSEPLIRAFVGFPIMIVFAIPILVLTLTVLPFSLIGWLIPIIALLPFFGVGFFLAIPAMLKLKITDKAENYYRIMNGKTYMNIEDLAMLSNETPYTVVNNLREMIDKRIFPEGHLDINSRCFMLSNDIYREYMALEDQRRSQQMLEDKSKTGEDIKEDNIISEGRLYILSIKELHLGITNEPMSSKLTRLENVLTSIFDRVEKEPKETGKLYKLMKYYLPTTLKLIKTYVDFDNVISPDGDILNTKKEIELTIDSINEACTEFQNRLYKDSVMDADTDAALLKVMLAKEGLISGGIDENNAR